jgi:hypothetical protein
MSRKSPQRIALRDIIEGQTFYECQQGTNIPWIALERATITGDLISLRARRSDTHIEMILREVVNAADIGYPRVALMLYDNPVYI